MNRFLIIPDLKNIEEHLSLADEYGFGFEYNDFYSPDVLDDEEKVRAAAEAYKAHALPKYCTCHGDFFDVLVFSEDKYIREIADKRIRQSIAAAKTVGAAAVVFHTNHEPMLTAVSYVDNWVKRNEQYFSGILEEYKDINIYIENMFDRSPDMLRRLSESLKRYENYGVCLDYAHAASFGKETPMEDWVTSLAPYVKHMHINDNDLESDLHLAVGDGRIDWNVFCGYYRKYFSQSTLLIEVAGIEKQRRSAEFLVKAGLFSKA